MYSKIAMERLHSQTLKYWIAKQQSPQPLPLLISKRVISHFSKPITLNASSSISPFYSFKPLAVKINPPLSKFRSVTTTASGNNIQGTIPNGGHGIKTSHFAEVYRKFTLEDVSLYGNLIGDLNPIHQSTSSKTTTTKDANKKETNNTESSSKVIVHGMLISSLFSSIFGTLIPGSIYRSQTLKFNVPVYVDDNVIGRVDVVRLRSVCSPNSANDGKMGILCTCSTKVFKQQNNSDGSEGEKDVECVAGEATVWLPGIVAA